MSNRLFRLMQRHQHLDRLIDLEQRRPARDAFVLLKLKKLKLAVKDRMAAVMMRRPVQGL